MKNEGLCIYFGMNFDEIKELAGLNIIEKVAEGGFGKVYRVEDKKGNIFALKCAEGVSIPVLKEEFYLLSQLNHPSIVKVFKFFKLEDTACYTMEFLSGKPIMKFFQPPLKDKEAFIIFRKIFTQILYTLNYIHRSSFLFGDLTPSHIIIKEDITPILIDIGGKQDIGTPDYAAPEFIRGHPSPQGDIYSLGIILYELLTGKKAFSGKSETQVIINNLEKKLKNIREINPSVPENIARIVMRMCEKDIYIRFRSVDAILSALTGTKYKEKPEASFYTRIIGRDDVLRKVKVLFQDVKNGDQKILQIYGERGIGKTRLLNEIVIKGILSGFAAISLKKILENPEILRDYKKPYLIYTDGEKSPYIIKDFYNSLRETYKNIPLFLIITGENKFPFLHNAVKLTPLKKQDIDEFITISLGDILYKKAFIEHMKGKSGGNPYLLITSLKYLIKTGILTYRDNIWQWDKNRIQGTPKDLTDFFKQEIKHLSNEERCLLELCALAGKKFPLSIIESIKGNEIVSSIVRLKNKGYIQSDDGMYYFTNSAFRNYLLKSMDKHKKEKWAGLIYKVCSRMKGISPEVMAEYAINAGDKEKAREYLITGGNHLLSKANPGGAFQLYKMAYNIKSERNLLNKMLDAADKSGLYKEGIQVFQSMKNKPSSTDILLKMARLYRKSGKKQEAKVIYQSIKGKKLSCEDIYEIANFYLRENEWERAKSLFELGMEKCKKNSRFLYGYAILLHLKKAYKRLWEILDEGIKISEQDKRMYASFLSIKSLALLDNGKFSSAYKEGIKAYKIFKALNDRQNTGLLLINLGYIQMHRGIMDRAEAHLKEAMTYFQELNDVHNLTKVVLDLALVERYRGNFREVEVVADRYKFNPEDEERIIYNLGLIYIYQGRFNRAEKIIDKIQNDLAGKSELLGILYSEKGRYADAALYLKRSKVLYKEEDRKDEVDILMADVMGKMGNKTGALEILKTLNKRIKGDTYLHLLIRRQIIYTNPPKGWEQEIKRILDMFHYRGYIFEYARTLYLQGEMLINLGKYREALESLMKAREIFGNIPTHLYLKRTEQGIIECAGGMLRHRPGIAYIEHLFIISRMLESIGDYSQLVRQVLETVISLMDAERGIIFLKADGGEIFPAYSIGIEKDKDVEQISFTAIRETMEGKPVVVMDASQDKRFKSFPSVKLNKIVSILSVPIKSRSRVIGSIYIDSRIKKSIFSEMDEKYLSALSLLMGNVLRGGRLIEELREKQRGKTENGFCGIIGTSPGMQRVYQEIKKVAPLDINILITGETGTGKELIARTIHKLSKRRDGKFLTIDCSSLPENILESELFGHTKGAFTGAVDNKMGLFEEGNGGTVFLDEIGDAPPNVQGELLRVIEKGEIRRLGETKWRNVDVRIIAATNKEIEFEVSIKRFREDLYFRLNAFRMHILPLRARENDVLLIADYFLKEFSKTMGKKIVGFSREVKETFLRYPWPGNVRELRNAVERGVAMAGGNIIEIEDIPPGIIPVFSKPQRDRRKKGISRKDILVALKKYPTKKEAARSLGISRRHLSRLIKKYEIEGGDG